MADYILQGMMDRWGTRFEELNSKRDMQNRPNSKPSLFDQLSETFNRSQLRAVLEQQGMTTPERVFICQWKRLRVIEEVKKGTYRKLDVKC